jgi:cytidine deaminase
MDVWNYFSQALVVAVSKNDYRDFLIGAIAIRKDGTKVASSNGPAMISGIKQKSFFSKAHAESRLCRKIDKGAIIFVIRVGKKDKQFKMAKPCNTCQVLLKSKKVSKIYYTISNAEYGVLTL